jgi:hypothetical protein
MVMSMLSQPSYSYVQDAVGSAMVSFSVTSPPLKTTGGCNTDLDPVFGNGNGVPPDVLPVAISIGTVTDVTGGGSVVLVPGPTLTAIVAAFGSPQFDPAMFDLTDPGTGTQGVDFTFTNDAAMTSRAMWAWARCSSSLPSCSSSIFPTSTLSGASCCSSASADCFCC